MEKHWAPAFDPKVRAWGADLYVKNFVGLFMLENIYMFPKYELHYPNRSIK